jgi:putative hydrolase of the HAD superfamily
MRGYTKDMNVAPIRHIIFDLGGTLMHERGDLAAVYRRADKALAETLRAYGIELDTQVFRARLHQYYKERDKNFEETTYHFVLRELLHDLGYEEIAESILRSALDALYAVTQTNWQLEDDALPMILKLKSLGYGLGILSNAGDDKDVQELVAGFGVRPYFDFVLTSAACYYRKPHPRAFEIALAQWNIQPEEAVMIGDNIQADIEGAKKLGLQAIWITRRAEVTTEEKQRIQPDFEIHGFAELFPILERINTR